MNKNGKKTNTIFMEVAALILFSAAFVIVSAYHEPWFDEAQSWQIAKCASFKEILLHIPHYEGHPPLWHLILAVPAKLGVPYEMGLKSVGFVISICCAFLIIFKSPFPLAVRLLLPFNYFFFYQYGIVTRPYGLLLLFLILLAIEFPCRHEKPLRFVSVLALICLTHSYGILIACGISVCYIWEMIEEKGIQRFFGELFTDKRIWALAGLLALAVLIILEILPKEDTFVATKDGKNSFFVCFLCTVFALIPECFCTTMNWATIDTCAVQLADIYLSNLAVSVAVGIFAWLAVFCFSSKKSFMYFALPYVLFALFGAAVYFTAHHTGIALGLLVFWLWITLPDGNRFAGWKAVCSKLKTGMSKSTVYALTCIGAVFLAIPIFWSASASVNDVKFKYSYGKDVADFLKRTGLENALIFRAWTNPEKDSSELKAIFCNADPTILAYFDRNLFANTNNGDSKKAYTEHIIYTESQKKDQIENWKKLGIPDVLVGYADMEPVYGDSVSITDYSPVFLGRYEQIYKCYTRERMVPVLLRNDLLEKYDVEIQDMSGYFTGLYYITPEMVEAYKNGEVTIEELLDDMLGSFGKA